MYFYISTFGAFYVEVLFSICVCVCVCVCTARVPNPAPGNRLSCKVQLQLNSKHTWSN